MRRLSVHLALAWLFATGALGAQSATDVIRGRVTDDSAHAVAGAAIHITRGPDRAIKQTTTDSTGRYQVAFENGTGDYLVAVSMTGLKPARRRVQRQGTETELVADFVLARDLSTLAAVKVTAQKPEKASDGISPYQRETGANEKWVDGVDGQVPPSLAGDLSAMAGTMSNVTMGPGGLSILGGSSESNLTTLNGMALPGGAVPRAARVNTRVTGATFDPTRGGFSGANIDVQLGEGSRQYQQRNAYFTIDAPGLQFTDPVGRSIGARTGSFRGSAGADGELIRHALTYNVSFDYLHASSDPATLLNGDGLAFQRAGVAPDSVARLLAVARPLGLPASGAGVPQASEHEVFTWLGRLDDTRDSLHQRTLTTYATSARQGALAFAPLTAPSAGGEQTQRTLGAQFQAVSYFAEGLRAMNTTRLAASRSRTQVTPYLSTPGASVVLRSPQADGSTQVATAALGGASYLANDDQRWTLEGSNETIWNADGRRHTFKAFAWARADGLDQTGGADLLGRYAFNSIADLAANHPSSYSRTLVQPGRAGETWNGALALAHQWAPSRWFSMLYGARVEADGFVGAPPRNAALEQALGVTTGLAPARLHVSPRWGFSWTYNRDKDNGNGQSSNPVGRFYRNTSGVIRGGIGEFRDLLRPGVLADARARTGLAGGATSLTCTGAAAPTP
ncbi:MAG: carboxypeptidase regulatory-like domain-containing protein, partial [Gemmatimonadetes bacterium]|nr:carboxypeptidase regulatory-like domain-containing protein [Gemmatimonadota bacterium]